MTPKFKAGDLVSVNGYKGRILWVESAEDVNPTMRHLHEPRYAVTYGGFNLNRWRLNNVKQSAIGRFEDGSDAC